MRQRGWRARWLAPIGGALLASACASGAPGPTATPLPTPVVVLSPPASPTLAPTVVLPTLPPPATATPSAVVVYGTGGAGLSVRAAPSTSAERIKVWPEGTLLQPLGEERQADGVTWERVRDPDNNEGWASSEFLVDPATATAQPAPTAPPAPPAAPTAAAPTRPVPELRPTFTPATAPAPAPKPAAPTAPAPTAPAPTVAPATTPTSPAKPVAPTPTNTPRRR